MTEIPPMNDVAAHILREQYIKRIPDLSEPEFMKFVTNLFIRPNKATREGALLTRSLHLWLAKLEGAGGKGKQLLPVGVLIQGQLAREFNTTSQPPIILERDYPGATLEQAANIFQAQALALFRTEMRSSALGPDMTALMNPKPITALNSEREGVDQTFVSNQQTMRARYANTVLPVLNGLVDDAEIVMFDSVKGRYEDTEKEIKIGLGNKATGLAFPSPSGNEEVRLLAIQIKAGTVRKALEGALMLSVKMEKELQALCFVCSRGNGAVLFIGGGPTGTFSKNEVYDYLGRIGKPGGPSAVNSQVPYRDIDMGPYGVVIDKESFTQRSNEVFLLPMSLDIEPARPKTPTAKAFEGSNDTFEQSGHVLLPVFDADNFDPGFDDHPMIVQYQKGIHLPAVITYFRAIGIAQETEYVPTELIDAGDEWKRARNENTQVKEASAEDFITAKQVFSVPYGRECVLVFDGKDATLQVKDGKAYTNTVQCREFAQFCSLMSFAPTVAKGVLTPRDGRDFAPIDKIVELDEIPENEFGVISLFSDLEVRVFGALEGELNAKMMALAMPSVKICRNQSENIVNETGRTSDLAYAEMISDELESGYASRMMLVQDTAVLNFYGQQTIDAAILAFDIEGKNPSNGIVGKVVLGVNSVESVRIGKRSKRTEVYSPIGVTSAFKGFSLEAKKKFFEHLMKHATHPGYDDGFLMVDPVESKLVVNVEYKGIDRQQEQPIFRHYTEMVDYKPERRDVPLWHAKGMGSFESTEKNVERGAIRGLRPPSKVPRNTYLAEVGRRKMPLLKSPVISSLGELVDSLDDYFVETEGKHQVRSTRKTPLSLPVPLEQIKRNGPEPVIGEFDFNSKGDEVSHMLFLSMNPPTENWSAHRQRVPWDFDQDAFDGTAFRTFIMDKPTDRRKAIHMDGWNRRYDDYEGVHAIAGKLADTGKWHIQTIRVPRHYKLRRLRKEIKLDDMKPPKWYKELRPNTKPFGTKSNPPEEAQLNTWTYDGYMSPIGALQPPFIANRVTQQGLPYELELLDDTQNIYMMREHFKTEQEAVKFLQDFTESIHHRMIPDTEPYPNDLRSGYLNYEAKDGYEWTYRVRYFIRRTPWHHKKNPIVPHDYIKAMDGGWTGYPWWAIAPTIAPHELRGNPPKKTPRFLYHGSPVAGLKILEPRIDPLLDAAMDGKSTPVIFLSDNPVDVEWYALGGHKKVKDYLLKHGVARSKDLHPSLYDEFIEVLNSSAENPEPGYIYQVDTQGVEFVRPPYEVNSDAWIVHQPMQVTSSKRISDYTTSNPPPWFKKDDNTVRPPEGVALYTVHPESGLEFIPPPSEVWESYAQAQYSANIDLKRLAEHYADTQRYDADTVRAWRVYEVVPGKARFTEVMRVEEGPIIGRGRVYRTEDMLTVVREIEPQWPPTFRPPSNNPPINNPKTPKGRKFPKRYLKGLNKVEKAIAMYEIDRGYEYDIDNPEAYEFWKSDIMAKAKGVEAIPSKHRVEFAKRYGPLPKGKDLPTKLAKATGIKKKFIKEAYKRGLAAWRIGHPPGVQQHQWASGRAYHLVMASDSTTSKGGPDFQLAVEAGVRDKDGKVLKNPPIPKVLYHGTSSKLAEIFLKEGKNEHRDQGNKAEHYGALKPEQAYNYALGQTAMDMNYIGNWDGDTPKEIYHPVVLQFNVEGLSMIEDSQERNFTYGWNAGKEFVVMENISPDRISVYKRYPPLAKHGWEDYEKAKIPQDKLAELNPPGVPKPGKELTPAKKREIRKKWLELVNMTKTELQAFYDSDWGNKKAGLSRDEAKEQGISSGRDSALAILKMKETSPKEWSRKKSKDRGRGIMLDYWQWAQKQINFNTRHRAMQGAYLDEKGRPNRKLLGLWIWGHDPWRYARKVSGESMLEAPDFPWVGRAEKKEFGVRPKLNPPKSCPLATQDLELNIKNRNAARDADWIQYGPLNLSDEGYWLRYAEKWNTTPDVAKQSNCSNCVAFDISPRMLDCLPGPTSEPIKDSEGHLGYCWMHHFKCHSARTCYTWAAGGPISEDTVSFEWASKAKSNPAKARKKKQRGTNEICPYPEKRKYSNRTDAMRAMKDNHGPQERQFMSVYECDVGGHYHYGHSYRINPLVLKPLYGDILAISGPSASGKSSIARGATKKLKGKMVPSYMTREKRPKERANIDGVFVSKEEFKSMIDAGEFTTVEGIDLWVEQKSGEYYGRRAKDFLTSQPIIVDVNFEGLRLMRKAFPNKVYSVFIRTNMGQERRRQRLEKRGVHSPEEIEQRVKAGTSMLHSYQDLNFDFISSNKYGELEKNIAMISKEFRNWRNRALPNPPQLTKGTPVIHKPSYEAGLPSKLFFQSVEVDGDTTWYLFTDEEGKEWRITEEEIDQVLEARIRFVVSSLCV